MANSPLIYKNSHNNTMNNHAYNRQQIQSSFNMRNDRYNNERQQPIKNKYTAEHYY